MSYKIVGCALNNEMDVVSVAGALCQSGKWDLYFSDGGNGIVNWYGFEGLRLKPIEKANVSFEGYKTTEDYEYARSIVMEQSRGSCSAFIFLEDGFLLVRDLDYPTAVIQPVRLGSKPDTVFEGSISVSEADDDTEDIEEICEILELE